MKLFIILSILLGTLSSQASEAEYAANERNRAVSIARELAKSNYGSKGLKQDVISIKAEGNVFKVFTTTASSQAGVSTKECYTVEYAYGFALTGVKVALDAESCDFE